MSRNSYRISEIGRPDYLAPTGEKIAPHWDFTCCSEFRVKRGSEVEPADSCEEDHNLLTTSWGGAGRGKVGHEVK